MIFGFKTSSTFPENWTPLDAVAVVGLDENGDLSFLIRSTKTLSDWECFSLLELAARSQSNSILKNLEDEEEDS